MIKLIKRKGWRVPFEPMRFWHSNKKRMKFQFREKVEIKIRLNRVNQKGATPDAIGFFVPKNWEWLSLSCQNL